MKDQEELNEIQCFYSAMNNILNQFSNLKELEGLLVTVQFK